MYQTLAIWVKNCCASRRRRSAAAAPAPTLLGLPDPGFVARGERARRHQGVPWAIGDGITTGEQLLGIRGEPSDRGRPDERESDQVASRLRRLPRASGGERME